MPIGKVKINEELLKQIVIQKNKLFTNSAVAAAMGINPKTVNRYIDIYRARLLAEEEKAPVPPKPSPAPIDRPELPTTQEKVKEIQKNIAGRCLSTAQRLITSLDTMTDFELRHIPASQRALAAGILVDKARLLTEQSTENISLRSLSWIQLVSDSMPKRAKDDLPGQTPLPDVDFLK